MGASTEQGKSLFIIRSKAEAVSATESYLRHRGWQVTTSAVIKDALSAILDQQPNYVLVCMDHPNSKAQLLPKLLEEAMGIKAIVYLEVTSPRALALVSRMDYSLYPPLSGTAVERMAGKIERDKKKKPTVSQMQILKGGNSAEARLALRQMIKSEESVAALGAAPLDLKPAAPAADRAVKQMLKDALASENTEQTFAAEVEATAKALADSPLASSSQRAIDAVARPTSTTPTTLIECSEMASFVIQSANHQGFILCAFAKEPQTFAGFVDAFRNKLVEFMAEIDPQVSTKDPMHVTVERVMFEDWAKQEAQFVKKFVHMDSECAVAYFNHRVVLPELRPTAGGMAEMNISDLIAEKQLGFDVFVHLPLNQKFVLYGKRGRSISGRQKSRLRQRGLKTVHVLEAQAAEVVRVWMQDYLDQKITAHKETVAQSDSLVALQKYAA